MGYRHLPKLRAALKRELKIDTTTAKKEAVSSRGRCNAMNDHGKEGSWVAFVVHGCHPREKAERWKRGESLSDIGRALGRIPGAVHHVVSARGGIPPPSRTRSRRSLTLTDRGGNLQGLGPGLLPAADRHV